MTTNNAKGTLNSPDGELKENVNAVQPDPTTGALAAATGGQVKGGVVASSGDRMQAANEDGTTTS